MTRRPSFTNLRDFFYAQASRYSPMETVRRRIVSVAIYAAYEDPDLVAAPNIDKALRLLIHNVACRELGLHNDVVRDKFTPRARTSSGFSSSETTEDLIMPNDSLSGRTYLVVEDEYLVASDMLTMLESAGAKVFGPVSDAQQAMEVLSEPSLELDAALLDINLHGEMVYPAAALLVERGTPFIFVTGYDCASMPKEFADAPCLSKPTAEADLVAALSAISVTRHMGLSAE